MCSSRALSIRVNLNMCMHVHIRISVSRSRSVGFSVRISLSRTITIASRVRNRRIVVYVCVFVFVVVFVIDGLVAFVCWLNCSVKNWVRINLISCRISRVLSISQSLSRCVVIRLSIRIRTLCSRSSRIHTVHS